MTDQTTVREQLLNSIDFSYCQTLGFGTPEGLLAAYEASRTQAVDQAALRETAEVALAAVETALGDTLVPAARAEALAALAAVLPATTNHDTDTSAPLSETERKMLDYALDLADEEIATDGSDFTDEEEDALAELRRIVTKPIATGTFELRGDTEIRAAVLREAADVAERLMDDRYGSDCSYAIGGLDVARELRRVADETAATETQAEPVQHAPGKAIRCPNCRDKGYTVCQDEPANEVWHGATEVISDREVERLAATGLVGYRQGRGRLLHCLHHKPVPASRWADFHEVTTDDLPDGGICVHPRCGADLLAVQPAAGARQDGTVAVPCVECGHPQTDHGEGEDPVTPGRCRTCPDDDAWHDYQAAAGARQDGAQS